MQTVKTGKEFTGYLMFRSRKTGAAVRIFVGRYFFNGYAADGKTPLTREEQSARIACPTGGSWDINQGSPIYGRYVDEVVCNSKCTGAIGHSCECSCGGKNHGGKFGGEC